MKTSTKDQHILVVGATGNLGFQICRQLAFSKKDVTALVRTSSLAERVADLQQLGVKLVTGDLKDATSINRALDGITTVISTATTVRSAKEGDSINSVDMTGQLALVEQAEARGVNRFIYVSFPPMQGDFPLQNAKRKVENRLIAGKMDFVILQPTYFMEAWLSPALGFDFPNAKATIYGDGTRQISWISIGDVAEFATAAITDETLKNKTIQLGGPEALSPHNVVQIFEKTLGKKFEVAHVPLEAIQQQHHSAPDDLTKTFTGLMLNYAAGSTVDMRKVNNDIPIRLSSVADYARKVFDNVQKAGGPHF